MYVLVAKKEAERILSLMKEISYYNQSAGGQAGQAGQAYTIWTWQEKFKKNNQFLSEKRAEK